MKYKMKKTKIISGIGIVFLLTLGVVVLPDDTHFCKSRELVMRCDRLSPTNITCYPYPEINSGYKRCSEGWIEIDRNETETDLDIKKFNFKEDHFYLECEEKNSFMTRCVDLITGRNITEID